MIGFPDAWAIIEAVEIADGIGGTVWRARHAGTNVVVKRASALALPELPHAIAFLRLRDGHGCVRLICHGGAWQMLEDAGDATLRDHMVRVGDDEATRIAAGALAALQATAPRSGAEGLMPLEEQFRSLFTRARSDGGIFGEAAETASRLFAQSTESVPLHGDLHHENILRGPRGWLAIDAKGLLGDPAYDAANLFHNPVESPMRADPERASRMATILSEKLGHARECLLDWGFAHSCLSAAWHLEDSNGNEAERSLAVAHALKVARLRP